MLKKGKKLFVILLVLCMVFISVCQVIMADEPPTDGSLNGTNDIIQNEGNQDNPDGQNGEGDGSEMDGEHTDQIEGGNKDEKEESRDVQQWISADLQFVDADGKEYGEDNPVEDGDVAKLKYSFNIIDEEGYDVKAGDYFIISTLPENFKGLEDYVGSNNSLEEGFPAHWTIDEKGQIKVTFEEGIEDISGVTGYFEFSCYIEIKEGAEDNITISLGGIGATVISFKTAQKEEPEKHTVVVEKSGELGADGIITWTIRATPDTETENASLASYVLTDDFSGSTGNMTYEAGSFTVDGEPVDDPEVKNGKFAHVFDENIGSGIRTVTYQTKLKSSVLNGMNNVQVRNTVKLEMPNKEASASATAAVSSNSIRKDKDSSHGKEFVRNSDGSVSLKFVTTVVYTGTNAYIVDNFARDNKSFEKITAGNCKYIDVSIQYDDGEEVVLEEGDGYTVGAITLGSGTDTWQAAQMKVNLRDGSHTAKLYYTAKISGFESTDKNYYEKIKVRNYAYLHLGSSVGNDYEDYDFDMIGADGLVFLKKSSTFTKDENGNIVINWKIEVNNNHHDMGESLAIRDTLQSIEGAQHAYVPGSFAISAKDKENKAVDTAGITLPEVKDDDKSFEMTIEGPGTNSYILTYRTKVTDMKFGAVTGSQTFKNNVTIEWNGKSETIKGEAKKEWKALITKNGDYDAKKSVYGDKAYFDWTIHFNGEGYAFHNAVITDSLPIKHHLAPGSKIYVNDQEIGTAESKTTPYYTLVDKENGNQVVEIHFPQTVTEKQTIKIRTVKAFEGGELKLEEKNIVNAVADEMTKLLQTSATVKVSYAPSVEKKTEYDKGDTVTWEINLNENGAVISSQNAVLRDALSEELEYIKDSAKLEIVNGKQTTEIDGLKVDYDMETRELVLTLPDGLDLTAQYRVTFDTDIKANVQDFKNVVTFSATAQTVESSSKEVTLKSGKVESGITGDNIKFQITKTDTEGNSLAGAEFQLFDVNGKVIDTTVSDQNGIVSFKKALKYNRSYTFNETKAPDGYILDGTVHTLKIGSKIETGAIVTIDGISQSCIRDAYNTLQISKSIINKATEIGFTKVEMIGDLASPLVGADLAIYKTDAEGKKTDELVSSWTSDGTVHVIKGILQPGQTYVLVENKAPVRYELAEDITFKINEDGTVTVNRDSDLDQMGNVQMIDKKSVTTPTTPPGTPTPTPPVTPIPPVVDPTPDPKPLPPDENLEDPEKPGDNDVVRPELPDDEHLQIDETTKLKSSSEGTTKTDNPELPATGDNAQLVLWTLLLLTSISAAVVIIVYRRETEK